MNDDDLPPNLLNLLARAGDAPEGLLILTGDEHGEEVLLAAERLTDLGLFRIVTARRYAVTEAGREILRQDKARKGRRANADGIGERPGWLSRLFGKNR